MIYDRIYNIITHNSSITFVLLWLYKTYSCCCWMAPVQNCFLDHQLKHAPHHTRSDAPVKVARNNPKKAPYVALMSPDGHDRTVVKLPGEGKVYLQSLQASCYYYYYYYQYCIFLFQVGMHVYVRHTNMTLSITV